MPINKVASSRGEAGFTLIDLLFTASLIATLCTMTLPSLLRARGAAQAASALSTLRVVNSSQLSFAVTCGSGFYAADFPTLGVAPPGSPAAFLPPELTSGTTFLKQGYTFTMSGTPLARRARDVQRQAAGQRGARLRPVRRSARPGWQPAFLRNERRRDDLPAHVDAVRGHA